MDNLGGYGYENYQNKHSMRKTSPPLSAIQRFLLGNNKSRFLVNTTQDNGLVSGEGSVKENCSNFAFPSDGNGDFSSGFGNGGFFNSKTDPNWMQEMYPNLGNKSKGGPAIKGQWTNEEDRALIDLVRKHGDKRWAKIAEKMHGRAGKQCRERWHNHLRADIKKDFWSEEEERMLIEAHIEVGNKWADIAKRIPGRTENSIKNHWNATKRRRNSKRKCKKTQEGQKGKSMLLQEYQIMIFGAGKSESTTPTSSAITEDKTFSESSDDDHMTPQLFDQTIDDELNFMMNLFPKKNDRPSNDNNNSQAMTDQSVSTNYKYEPVISDSLINVPVEEIQAQTYLSSDLYISYLFDKPTINSPNSMNEYYGNINVDSMGSSSNGKGDMDLMEFLAYHQMFSLGGNTNLEL